MAKEEPKMLVANESFSLKHQGVDYSFHQDETRVWSDDPIAQGIEHLFREVAALRPRSLWEAATAAPGEVRGAEKPKAEPVKAEVKAPEKAPEAAKEPAKSEEPKQ